MKKTLCIVLCLAMFFTLFTGCAKTPATDPDANKDNTTTTTPDANKDNNTTTPDANKDNTTTPSGRTDINFAITSEPKTLTPFEIDEYTGFTVCYQLYDRLIEIESDGTVTPGLAESWELAPDSKSITFKLRQGVKFHNGDELTAEDVVFTYDKAIASAVTAGVTSAMDHMEKVDDSTVKLVLKEAFAAAESCVPFAQLSIISKSAYEADPDAFARNPVGTGPYKFGSWEIGNKITLTANDDYYDGAPAIKDVTFKIILDTNTVVMAMQNGEVDICDTAPSAGRSTIENDKNLEWYACPSAGSNFIIFNNAKEPFNDKRVRQAVALALDKESIVIGALEGDGEVAQTLMARSVPQYPSDFVSAYDQQNIEKAKQLLADAGYPNGFDIVCPTMDSELFVPATEMFQDMLAQIGINVTVEKYERNVWLDKVRVQHDYQFCHMNTNASYPDADYLYPLFHSSYFGGKNWADVNLPELDKLLEEGRSESDPEKRNEIYAQIVQIMDDECVVAPIYNKNMGVAAAKGLQNVVPSATRRLFINEYSWA